MVNKSNVWIFICMFSATCCDVCHDNCKQSRIQGLYSADCFDRNLREVPDCLSRSVEILDLSLNRIRKVTDDDLQKYGYIQILYLTDNVITNISEGALQDKSELHTLDISYNVLYNIPKAVFHLPKLRKLYMSHVESPNMAEDIESSRPIDSPLVYLDLSYNKLPKLPNLGVVPSLQKLNISGNAGMRTSAGDFAGLCNLELLINEGASSRFDDQCECWKAEVWLRQRNVTFASFGCEPLTMACSKAVSPEDQEVYNNCRILHEEQMLQSFTSKLLTNIGIAAAVVVLLLILTLVYVIRRKKQKKLPRHTKN